MLVPRVVNFISAPHHDCCIYDNHPILSDLLFDAREHSHALADGTSLRTPGQWWDIACQKSLQHPLIHLLVTGSTLAL